MYNFNRGNNRFGGRRDFNRQGFGRIDSSDRSMHRATCSKCGNDCEVPFRPTGEKPVYCSKCFENMRGSDSRRFEGRNIGGNTDEQYKRQFETLNWKLDKILKIITPIATADLVHAEKIEKEVRLLNPKKATQSAKKKIPVVEKETSVQNTSEV